MKKDSSLSSRLGLGRLAYHLWYKPASAIRDSIRLGGPLEQARDRRGKEEMERAATSLPVQAGAPSPGWPEVHFLTGRRFWYQTAFCLHSLQRFSGCTVRAVVHDDGSLDGEFSGHLRRLFPGIEIRLRADNDAKLHALLPPDKFPYLQDRRRHYPNILKLTDAHAGGSGWKMVLDSDMLFFRRPDFFLSWMEQPTRPFHMIDVEDSYGYPLDEMATLAGAPIPHLVNVGFTGLRSEDLDWEKLEYWCRVLTERYGTSYYLEQALVAMVIAGRECAIAPANDYRLAPNEAECRQPTAALHHYVADSKRWYFRGTWRRIASL